MDQARIAARWVLVTDLPARAAKAPTSPAPRRDEPEVPGRTPRRPGGPRPPERAGSPTRAGPWPLRTVRSPPPQACEGPLRTPDREDEAAPPPPAGQAPTPRRAGPPRRPPPGPARGDGRPRAGKDLSESGVSTEDRASTDSLIGESSETGRERHRGRIECDGSMGACAFSNRAGPGAARRAHDEASGRPAGWRPFRRTARGLPARSGAPATGRRAAPAKRPARARCFRGSGGRRGGGRRSATR